MRRLGWPRNLKKRIESMRLRADTSRSTDMRISRRGLKGLELKMVPLAPQLENLKKRIESPSPAPSIGFAVRMW